MLKLDVIQLVDRAESSNDEFGTVGRKDGGDRALHEEAIGAAHEARNTDQVHGKFWVVNDAMKCESLAGLDDRDDQAADVTGNQRE